MKEAKLMWKKAKDAHRYLQGKSKRDKAKSGDAAPDMDDAEEDAEEGERMDDDMCFLVENSSMQLRDTVSAGGASLFADESLDSELPSTSSNYSYAAGAKKRFRGNGDGDALEAAQMLSQTISSYFQKKEETSKGSGSGLKYESNWKQIEQMYERLDEDTAIDLNFQFMAQTHNAVVAARKST